MGLDLSKITTSVLLGFFIFSGFIVAWSGVTTKYQEHDIGIPITTKDDFGIDEVMNQTEQITNKIQEKGPDDPAVFFPAINTLFDVWNLVKSTIATLIQSVQYFFGTLGGGSHIVLLMTIFGVIIAIAIAFIVLSSLFKLGGFKEQ